MDTTLTLTLFTRSLYHQELLYMERIGNKSKKSYNQDKGLKFVLMLKNSSLDYKKNIARK